MDRQELGVSGTELKITFYDLYNSSPIFLRIPPLKKKRPWCAAFTFLFIFNKTSLETRISKRPLNTKHLRSALQCLNNQ